MKKYFLLAAKVLLVIFSILVFIALVSLDTSITPVDSYLTPEVQAEGEIDRKPVVLVTYADGPATFFQNQYSLVHSASDKCFDTIHLFKRSHIDKNFWKENKDILMEKRGSGYWLWKPYFILKTMEKLPYGAIVLYADSGVIFKKPLGPLVKLLEKYDIVAPIYGKYIPTIAQIKKEAYKVFDEQLTPKVLKSPSSWAFFLAIKNTPKTQEFIRKWLRLCQHKYAIADQPIDLAAQHPKFEYHLHDQAILSVLLAQNPDNKLLIRRPELRKKYGVENFHRHPEWGFESPLFLIANINRRISKIVWNNSLAVKLRKALARS